MQAGFKPSISGAVAEAEFLTDFYRFQVKEARLKEWSKGRSRVMEVENALSSMAKRRRFDL